MVEVEVAYSSAYLSVRREVGFGAYLARFDEF